MSIGSRWRTLLLLSLATATSAMSRTPPSLEYLVIYNRTLQAPPNVPNDDDDAQEEAHILFYTCKPGGVKRDKMLRQVGLAKALISFSELVIL
jgi:hypothetical protein